MPLPPLRSLRCDAHGRVASVATMLFLGLAASLASAQHLEPNLVDALQWRAIGPAAIGGRIVDIEVDSRRTQTIFVASASGGLFRSRNNGTTWECIFENEGTSSIGDIAVDPTDSDVVWIGTGEANNQRSAYWGDGVYKTTDGGKSWVNTGLTDSHHIGRVVIDPRDSDVVYVAAMGHQYTTNNQRGLYKTTDGGRTWKRKLFLGDAIGVIDVAIDPKRPDRLFAASYDRLRRPWHFDGAGPGSAIHRSDDGGETWTRLEGGLPDGEIGRIGLSIFPGNSDIVYASISDQNPRDPAKGKGDEADPSGDEEEEEETQGRPRLGILGEAVESGGIRVTSVVAGESAAKGGIEVGDVLLSFADQPLSQLSDLVERIAGVVVGDVVSITLKRGDEEPKKVDVTFVERQETKPPSGEVGGGIYRSDDGGDTWTRRNDEPVGGNPPYYYGQIRVDPNDAERVWLLGVPVYRSNDGGKTVVRGNQASSLHVDHHALWIDPQDSDHILLGNDGGLGISYDAGAHWDHVNNLPIAQFYTVSVDMAQPYNVYGGTQDNGSWQGPSQTRGSEASHIHWRRIGGGDGFYVQVDPEEGRFAFVESQFGVMQRLDMIDWRSGGTRPRPAKGEDRYRFNWSSPILMSSHNSRIVYFGGNRLFKSLDNGETWRAISDDLSTRDAEKLQGNVPHCTVTTIAESRFDPDRLLVGTDDGNVQWTNDGGHTFENLADRFSGLPANLWVSRVAFSPHDENTAYVSFTGYREDQFAPYVFRTRDGGEMWESIVGNLPPGPVNVVLEDPRKPNLLYVGTEFGVYATADGGVRWAELSNGMPTVASHDLVVHPRERELVAGTHGRGFLVVDIAPLQELTPKRLEQPAYLCDVKDVIRWRRRGEPSEGFAGDRVWHAPNPSRDAVLWLHTQAATPTGTLKVEIFDVKGTLLATLDVSGEAGLRRVTWNLRRDPPPDQEQGGEGDTSARRRRGPSTVPAGTYTVKLSLASDSWSKELTVRTDPADD